MKQIVDLKNLKWKNKTHHPVVVVANPDVGLWVAQSRIWAAVKQLHFSKSPYTFPFLFSEWATDKRTCWPGKIYDWVKNKIKHKQCVFKKIKIYIFLICFTSIYQRVYAPCVRQCWSIIDCRVAERPSQLIGDPKRDPIPCPTVPTENVKTKISHDQENIDY